MSIIAPLVAIKLVVYAGLASIPIKRTKHMSDKEISLAFGIIAVLVMGGLIATNHGTIDQYVPMLSVMLGYFFGRSHAKSNKGDEKDGE